LEKEIIDEELQKHFVKKTFKQRKLNKEFTGRHKSNYGAFQSPLDIFHPKNI